MTKLCIFDLDGTVLDTVGTIAHYGNLSLEKNGVEPIPLKEYNYLAGDGARVLIRRMLEFRHSYTQELWERVYSDYMTAYDLAPTYGTSVFEGLKEVLDSLKGRGIDLAVVSNKPDPAAKAAIRTFYGEGYFSPVIGASDGLPLKPDPTAVLALAKAKGVSAADCLYVGDTSTDMLTGKRAGMFTVGVLWGFRGREELLENGADAIIERPKELLKYILE